MSMDLMETISRIRNLMQLNEISQAEAYDKFYQRYDQDTYNALVACDPKSNENTLGQNAKWLLKVFQDGKDQIDTDKIKEAFNLYEEFKKVKDLPEFDLAKNVYDLNSFKSLSDFLQYAELLSQSERKQSQKEVKSGLDYTKVYEDENWKVLRPNDMEASCALGKGTKWCTAAERGNRFSYYTGDGEYLIILFDKATGKKYQAHVISGRKGFAELRDSEDNLAIIDTEYKINHETSPLPQKLIDEYGIEGDDSGLITIIDENERTFTITDKYVYAIHDNIYFINDRPNEVTGFLVKSGEYYIISDTNMNPIESGTSFSNLVRFGDGYSLLTFNDGSGCVLNSNGFVDEELDEEPSELYSCVYSTWHPVVKYQGEWELVRQVEYQNLSSFDYEDIEYIEDNHYLGDFARDDIDDLTYEDILFFIKNRYDIVIVHTEDSVYYDIGSVDGIKDFIDVMKENKVPVTETELVY